MKGILSTLIITALFIFDESHQEIFSARNMNEMGYSGFAKLIIEEGHEFTINHSPLSELLPLIEKVDDTVLVLLPASDNPPDEEELRNIKSFVSKGGKLLLIGEHFDENGRLGRFTASVGRIFGYEFENETCVKSEEKDKVYKENVTDFFSPLFGIKGISTACAGVLKKYPPGHIIMQATNKDTPPRAVSGHCSRYENGKVCVLTDPEMFVNDIRFTSIKLPKTERFAKKIIEFLQGRTLRKEKVPCIYGGGISIITYDTNSLFSKLPSGFLRFTEKLGLSSSSVLPACKTGRINIFLAPFEPDVSILRSDGKILIAFDRNEGIPAFIKGEFPPRVNEDVIKFEQFVEEVKKLCGATALKGVLISIDKHDYLNVIGSFQNKSITFMGGTGIGTFGRKNLKPLISFPPSAYLETIPLNASGDIERVAVYNPEYDVKDVYGAVECGNILVIGDTDILTNRAFISEYGRKFIEYILSFLKPKN